MHDTSYETMQAFVRVHLDGLRGTPLSVLDFGSQVVDGQPKSYATLIDDPEWGYRGLDIEAGNNVDVVVADAYDWHEVPTDSVDLVISGQAFEHVEFFWASMFEIVRVLKPGGVAAIIAPSGGFEHRYPVDCWRFYPDGFRALARYVGCELVDVFTDWQHGEWDDSILVARKPEWDDAGRADFARRAERQRSLLPGAGDEPPTTEAPPAGEPSALRDLVPGSLTDELERMRARRLAVETEDRAAAEREREAAAAAARAAADAEVDRRVAEHLAGVTPLRWYGRVRSGVARLAGGWGRAAYRRVRGRA